MANAQMFDEDDPTLARLEELCLGFPDAKMKVSHGRPAFYTTNVFAYYGGSIKVDGSYVQHGQSLVFLPSPDEAEALAQDERIYRPAYLGAYGWLGLDLGPDPAHMPELGTRYGYYVVLGVMATIMVVLYVIFRRLKWL